MKMIAIVTNGILPFPAVKGGGAETLVQQLLDENEKQQKYKFIIYSVLDKKLYKHKKNISIVNSCLSHISKIIC